MKRNFLKIFSICLCFGLLCGLFHGIPLVSATENTEVFCSALTEKEQTGDVKKQIVELQSATLPQTYDNGFVMSTNSAVTYNVPEGFRYFTTHYGRLSSSTETNTYLAFEIRFDGQTVYRSKTARFEKETGSVTLKIPETVKTLTMAVPLRVPKSESAAWGNPKFCNDAEDAAPFGDLVYGKTYFEQLRVLVRKNTFTKVTLQNLSTLSLPQEYKDQRITTAGNYTLTGTYANGSELTYRFRLEKQAYPSVEGVEDGEKKEVYAQPVVAGAKSVTLTKNDVIVPFESGDILTDFGNYVLTVNGENGETLIVAFEVGDFTPPEITNMIDGGSYRAGIKPTFKDINLKGAVLYRDDVKVAYKAGDTINQAGSYRLEVSDVSGNVTEISFTVTGLPLSTILLISAGVLLLTGAAIGISLRLRREFKRKL